MIIGNFRYDQNRDAYLGEIKTLMFHRANVQFRSFDKCHKDDPDYQIVEEGHLGAIELGGAWERQDKKGKEYLAVYLSDPILRIEIEAKLIFIGDDWATLVFVRKAR